MTNEKMTNEEVVVKESCFYLCPTSSEVHVVNLR